MTPLEQLPIPLLEWYRDNARRLPWRDDPTAYHVWVSEVMLQQTRVAAVLDYYRRFMEEVPDVQSLAALGDERLMKLWQGLGYYSRARSLKAAATEIMTKHGGQFPTSYEEIRALKGVGDYTAGAISSIAFSLPVPAVDGNVLRVIARITGDEGDISTPAMKKKVTEALSPIIPLHAPGAFNQALMELGATVCLPNGAPLCDRCPAAPFCVALRDDRTKSLPVKAKKKPRKIQNRTLYLIFCGNRVALRKREDKGLLAGLWEYPDLLPPGITDEGEYGGQAKHIFTHIEWHMTARILRTHRQDLPQGWVWAALWELREVYPIPSAFDGFNHLVEEELHHDL